MEMNNLRTESHVAQKNRRHKVRFQQNSNDPDSQSDQVHRPRYGSISFDPNVYPSEMLQSIANNPRLLLPFDQDSGSGSISGSVSVSASSPASLSQPVSCKTIGDWKTVDLQNQRQICSDNWNVVLADQRYSNQHVENVHFDDHDHKTSSEIPAFGCSSYYQNTLQEVVTSATIPCWMNANSDQLGFYSEKQGLSLSLSSVPQSKTAFPNLHSGPKSLKTGLLTNSDPKQLMGMSSFGHRTVNGPLGPFTGYATILKNSKYLKPAQELLNSNCGVGCEDLVNQGCDNTRKILEEELSRVYSGECGASSSSSTIYGSGEHMIGRSNNFSESYRPEFHHKKAKLLYMQEEVCRRYKQYNQQMQLVISSFETVAGLASATPFVSLALKSVSRHFHFVKNAISEQLAQMKKTVEDLCSPSSTFGSNSTNDSLSQLKSMGHNVQGSFGNQQHLWRPQRGLPERAVSVLKAWLFDHFLHPYPSDADKHMLATQTGLTRNQVSNWFINARVRIWKPMVEEIHTLETKGLVNPNPNPNNAPTDHGQDSSHIDAGSLTNTQQSESLRSSGTLTMANHQTEPNDQQLWDHEKRSRPDYHIPQPAMDRAFANMMPYPRTTFDQAGGVGPVSLTLGLRQNAEHVQQLQQHESQLRQRFEGQLIHDFVG